MGSEKLREKGSMATFKQRMENMNFFSLLIKKVFLFSKEKLGEECLN
jgi:hypothetical protein